MCFIDINSVIFQWHRAMRLSTPQWQLGEAIANYVNRNSLQLVHGGDEDDGDDD